MSTPGALRTKAATAVGAIVLTVLVSLPGDLLGGQDPAGNAMLAGLLGLPAMVTGLILGVQTWRAATRAGGSLDRVTTALCRLPLTLVALLVCAVIVAIAVGT